MHSLYERVKKVWFVIWILLVASWGWGCRKSSQNPQGAALSGQSMATSQGSQEKATALRFRNLLAFHLGEQGLNPQSIHETMFLQPNSLNNIPKARGIESFLKEIDKLYFVSKPEDWYNQGRSQPSSPVTPKSGSGVVTLVVFPGFSSEFIPVDPFEEILKLGDRGESAFAKKVKPSLEAMTDEVYSVRDQKQRPVKLSEVVRVGSYDRNGHPWVNIIMLSPKLGSLESIGKLASTVPIYQRRLDKILRKTPDLGKIYLLGHSRGANVALEFLRATSLEARKYPWVGRIEGLVGLGAVFYGTQMADEVFSTESSPQQQMRVLLTDLMSRLEEEPQGLTGKAYTTEVAARVLRNANAYRKVLAQFTTLSKPAAIDLLIEEERLRHVQSTRELPGLLGNFEMTRGLLFDLINMQCPFSCYFQNIKAFKQVVNGVLEGIKSLTTPDRMAWWKHESLPTRFRILSLAATMAGPVENHKLSPIIGLPHYGYCLPDFTLVQRPSYYFLLNAGGGPLNDSAVSVARSRYWPQLDSMSGRSYDFLGVMASHHFGIAFPAAVVSQTGGGNSFPRSALLGALGSYLRDL